MGVGTQILTSALQRGSPQPTAEGVEGWSFPGAKGGRAKVMAPVGLGHWGPLVNTLPEPLLCTEVGGDQA